jgi:hypothetical protein
MCSIQGHRFRGPSLQKAQKLYDQEFFHQLFAPVRYARSSLWKRDLSIYTAIKHTFCWYMCQKVEIQNGDRSQSLLALSLSSRFCASFSGVDDGNMVATTFACRSAPLSYLSTFVACFCLDYLLLLDSRIVFSALAPKMHCYLVGPSQVNVEFQDNHCSTTLRRQPQHW